MGAPDGPGWVVYSRPGCSLCEAMYAQLTDLLGPVAADVTVVDITGDAELERRYGPRIPVLLIDGDFVCAWRLDLERVRPYLREGDRGHEPLRPAGGGQP